jgi:hypothetical protein
VGTEHGVQARDRAVFHIDGHDHRLLQLQIVGALDDVPLNIQLIYCS